jgi:hypothetical protein
MNLLALVLLVGVGGGAGGTTSARATTACPADDPYTRPSVLSAISDARIRSDLGLTAVDPSHLRALADPGDTAACQTLRGLANAAPDPATVMSWAYYTADGFYFAGSWQNKVGTHGFLYVFDSAWKLKEVMSL